MYTLIWSITALLAVGMGWGLWMRRAGQLRRQGMLTPSDDDSDAGDTDPKGTKTVSYHTVDTEGNEIHFLLAVKADDNRPTMSDAYIRHLQRMGSSANDSETEANRNENNHL